MTSGAGGGSPSAATIASAWSLGRRVGVVQRQRRRDPVVPELPQRLDRRPVDPRVGPGAGDEDESRPGALGGYVCGPLAHRTEEHMEHARYDQLEPYVTRDGSTIREWAGPGYAAEARNQSLAEATVAPGGVTIEHLHRRSEELYLVTAGSGVLRVGDEERASSPATAWRSRRARRTGCATTARSTWSSSAPARRRTRTRTPSCWRRSDGVELREARRGDESAVADIHVRAWQEAYRGLIPDEFLDALDPEDRARTYTFESPTADAPTTLLAVQEGEDCGEMILGFVDLLPLPRRSTPPTTARSSRSMSTPTATRAAWDGC